MSTPNVGIPYVPEGTLDPAAGLNLALNIIDALLQTRVLSMSLTAPPGAPVDGALYIVAGTGGIATGAWAGEELNLARFVDEGDLWQFYVAGSQAHLVLNIADGGFYKFIPGSPGGWVLAAGLSDAPSDGNQYVRRNALWQALVGTLTLSTSESPPISVEEATSLIIDPTRLELTDVAPNVAMLSARKQFATVVNTSSSNTDATADSSGSYTRFSHATATYTFNDSASFEVGAEYHGRNVGAGTVTITAAGTMTINAPASGSLIVPAGGTFTVKIVASNQADLLGVTNP